MSAAATTSRRAARVLVVESDPELRRYFVDSLGILPGPSLRVVEADSLENAAPILKTQSVDLVIGAMDGPCGGPALCSQLGVGADNQTPVLLISTGVTSRIEGRDVARLRTTTILQGPISALGLCRAAEEILRNPRTGRTDPQH